MAAHQSAIATTAASRTQTMRTTIATQWKSFAPRERLALTIAGAAIIVVLVWLTALRPALRTLREAPAQIAALESELQSMRALAADTSSLRSATPVSRSQAIAALEAATRELGGSGRMAVVGDRATLTLDGSDPRRLIQWLELARSAARARPIEMQIVRGPRGFAGSLVVVLSASS